ncbi:GNAT family N-acetyltransferase [Oerskovia enterophila]|uniref:GNAT family N-acetyltransferase n=1 Tax=Oerskovia enterophila TaxID=43678 RepID=UPI00382D9249
MSPVTSRLVRLSDVTPAEAGRWADLVDRALEPNPFLSPAYLLSASRWLTRTAGILLLVVERDDRMIALLPLSREDRFHGTPLRYATTAGAFLKDDAPLCAPLVDTEHATVALDGLLGFLADRRNGVPPLVELTLLPGSGALHEALHDACRRAGVPMLERSRFERAFLDRASDAPAPRDALSRSKRKQVERLTRRLEEATGSSLVMEDRGDDPHAFETFVALEAAGWKGDVDQDGGALEVTPGAVEWFTDVTDGLRERKNLRLLTLTAGEDVVYMSLLLGAGGSLYSLMDTYDERFAKFSPGVIGRVMEQEFVLGRTTADRFDPCLHPKNVGPSGLYRDRRTLVGVVLATRGLLPRFLVRSVPTLRRLRARVVGTPRETPENAS